MIWELINPSDAIVFETDSVELAALAVAVVGRGQYGAEADCTGKNVEIPMFAFQSSEETDKWFIDYFGASLEQSLSRRKSELPAVLRSFTLGHPKDLESYNLSLSFIPLEKHQEFKSKWKEQRRSSMNDICGYAWQCADELEGTGTHPANIPPPQTLFRGAS
jgi:hypothetical protein